MRRWRICLLLALAIFWAENAVAQFVLFPKSGELASPSGRFVVRNVERDKPASEFVGIFHSLWLEDTSTRRSRKLCDYFDVTAVAWSGDDFLLMTEYFGKKSSRALVFAMAHPDDLVVVDKPTLIRLVPAELRPTLRQNDHVFIEASRMEGTTLRLRVWGHGQHDANGFRWRCDYAMAEGSITCLDQSGSR